MAIDVGPGATNRGSSWGNGYTTIDMGNPANAAGNLDTLEIWAYTNMANVRIGVFYLVSGTTYKCRSSTGNLGTVTAGSKVTFTAPDDFTALAIETGDFIGAYWTAGSIEKENTGGSGILWKSGEYIDPNDQATYTNTSSYVISLYGSGSEGGGIVSLAASINASAAIFSNSSVNRKLASAIPSAGGIAGAVSLNRKFASLIAGTGGIAATAKVNRQIAAQIAAVGSVQGSLTKVVPMAAIIAGLSNVASSARITRGLTALMAAQGGLSASMTMNYALAAQIAGAGGIAGSLSVTGGTVDRTIVISTKRGSYCTKRSLSKYRIAV